MGLKGASVPLGGVVDLGTAVPACCCCRAQSSTFVQHPAEACCCGGMMGQLDQHDGTAGPVWWDS